MSETFEFDLLPNRIGTRSVKWDEAAADILPLWVADMDFATAPCVQKAIAQRAQHPCYGYTLVPEEYYEAIVRWFGERHGWRIERQHILYTTGVIPAIAAILRAHCQTGDHVVMMTPVYNCFYSCIRNAGATASTSTLIKTEDEAGRMYYTIDWDDLEQRLQNERATTMLLCNPHNPVGRLWTAEELRRIATLCKEHNVLLISDEIHNELARPGTEYVPMGTVLTDDDKALLWAVCTSPSKAFNIAGLQNANIIVGNSELRRRIDRAINLNETCDVNPFGVEALMAAYNEGGEWLDALRKYIWENYAYACAYLNKELPQLKIADMQATYLMWVDYGTMCQLPSTELRKRLMDEARVWMAEGEVYGQEGEHCLRINLATSRQRLEEALKRLTGWLRTNC